MSNELQVSVSITVNNENFTFPRTGNNLQHDQTTAGGGLPGYVVTSTSEATIDTTSLVNEGWCFMKNIDDTDGIEYGPDSTGMVSFGLLGPGEEALFKLKPGVVMKVKATANSPAAMIFVFEA
jgi:hypothetical protein